MRARLWLNLGLLIVVLVLIALAWFQPGTGEAPEPALTDLDPKSLTHITLSDPDGERAALKRTDGGWQLTSPKRVPAGSSRLQPLLELLSADMESELGKLGDEAAKYGFKEPALTVDYGKLRIAFGDEHPVEAQRYVSVDGRLALIADRHYRAADKSWTELASQRLLPEGAEITAIRLAGRLIERKDKGGYQVTPAKPAVAKDAADKLVRTWRNVRAMSVVEHSGGVPGASTPIAVKLAGRDTPMVFHAWSHGGQLRIARPGTGVAYDLPSSKRSRLLELASPKSKEDSGEGASAGGGDSGSGG